MFRGGVGTAVIGTAVVGKAVVGMSVIGGNPLGSLFKKEMLSVQPEIYKLKTRNLKRRCFPPRPKD
jgi:5,10-methylene-tetrahydrofolate dehydrogenase/methenyl tetrahydrofolate cyclohydrolase